MDKIISMPYAERVINCKIPRYKLVEHAIEIGLIDNNGMSDLKLRKSNKTLFDECYHIFDRYDNRVARVFRLNILINAYYEFYQMELTSSLTKDVSYDEAVKSADFCNGMSDLLGIDLPRRKADDLLYKKDDYANKALEHYKLYNKWKEIAVPNGSLIIMKPDKRGIDGFCRTIRFGYNGGIKYRFPCIMFSNYNLLNYRYLITEYHKYMLGYRYWIFDLTWVDWNLKPVFINKRRFIQIVRDLHEIESLYLGINSKIINRISKKTSHGR